jgi:hypothetical protein
VTQQEAAGYLTLYTGSCTVPLASNVNFRAGQTRASNALVQLSSNGAGSLAILNGSAGSAHVILDVNGYFE